MPGRSAAERPLKSLRLPKGIKILTFKVFTALICNSRIANQSGSEKFTGKSLRSEKRMTTFAADLVTEGAHAAPEVEKGIRCES